MELNRWLDHFSNNQLNRPRPPWDAPMRVADEVRLPLVRSLEQFQLGDGGGPAFLIGWDRDRWLAADPDRRALVELWFKEEEEHSRLLGKAVERFGGTPITGHWSFSLFCGMRKWLGVRFELTALLLTEIVSNVYYKLLSRGDDPALQAMCRLIIRDETGHIAFHRARLAAGGVRVGPLRGAVFQILGLAAGTTLWVNHRPAVVATGGSTREFYRLILRDTRRFIDRLNRDVARAGRGATTSGAPQAVPADRRFPSAAGRRGGRTARLG